MKTYMKVTTLGALFLSANAFAGGTCTDDNLNAWDAVNTGANPANNVSITGTNPLDGDCSLSVPLELGGKRYVQDDMDQENSFRMSFKFDPNSFPMPTEGADRRIKLASVLCVDGGNGCGSTPSGTPNFQGWWQTKLRLQPTGYKLGSWVQQDDASNTRISHTVDVLDGCNTIEIQLVAGNPGIYRMWVNNTNEGAPDFEVTDADFDLKFTDTVRVGKTAFGSEMIGDTPGAFMLVDDYESRRQTFIGDSCTP